MKYISDSTDNTNKNADTNAYRNADNAATYSLTELCHELSISTATGRNWLRLGKLTPSGKSKKQGAYFSKEYVNELKKALQTGDNKSLKSRRNKRYVSGNALYDTYISESSANIKAVRELLGRIVEYGLEVTDGLIKLVVVECARQLLLQNGNDIYARYETLINDLLDGVKNASSLKKNYPSIFDISYVYEEGEDILGLIYISCRNMANRKASGSYYTPTGIVQQLLGSMELEDSKNTSDTNAGNTINTGKNIIDPCCGTGNFLLQLPECFSVEQVYGNDLDDISVKIARINMALKYKPENTEILYNNITCGDFLRYNEKNNGRTFDYIIGNPPWGYAFDELECAFLRENYRSAVGKNIESYDVFVEKSISRLKQGGELLYVLPEAILNVKSHKPVRQLIMECCAIRYISYLGNVFHGVQCPSIIIRLKKNSQGMSEKDMNRAGNVKDASGIKEIQNIKIQEKDRSYIIKKPRTITPEKFSFRTTDEEYELIRRMKSLPNAVYLKGNAIFALGIVTGNNEEYITHTKTDANERIIKGLDVEPYHINEADNYIEFRAESLQQVAPVEYYRAPEKLVYRFIGNKLVFAYDDRQLLTLNSCNILIPHIGGLDIKYIMAVLNSDIVQFFYEKEFGSVKVLRSHLEQIPIPQADDEKQQEITELVELLLQGRLEENERAQICKEINKKVEKLYMN